MSNLIKKGSVVDAHFVKPRFRYKGKEYNSAEVEAAAQDGDEEALFLIANLAAIGASCISTEPVPQVEETPETKKAPKKAKKEEKEATHE